MSKRKDTNWESKLSEEDMLDKKVDGKQIKTVLLKGLKRLARDAGLIKTNCVILNPSTSMVQAIYTSEFDDGSIWVGCGDCSSDNTSKPYSNYPTAVAESRAAARSLKDALGITMLASEEIDVNAVGGKEIVPTGKIDSSVIAAIERLCEIKQVSAIDLVRAIISDKERANSIFEFKQLTVEDGQKAMEYLNSIRLKKGKKS